jgi:hypothetical protein
VAWVLEGGVVRGVYVVMTDTDTEILWSQAWRGLTLAPDMPARSQSRLRRTALAACHRRVGFEGNPVSSAVRWLLR